VWPDSFVGEDSLTQNIAALRKALGDTPDRPQYIATVPRHGYRFVAPVQAIPDPSDIAAPLPERSSIPLAKSARWTWAVAGVAGLLALISASLTIAVLRRPPPPSTPAVYRFVVDSPGGTRFSASASFLAVSPDGRWLAFLASRAGEESRLWVRALDSLNAREVTGTEGALGPFWSPDSRFLAFFANGTLKKVGIFGGSPVALCEGASGGSLSGSWHRNGTILFTHRKGIYRISAEGGAATPVTALDQIRGELEHSLPQFLPDGRHFLYITRVSMGASFESWIVLRSLDAADDRRLLTTGSQAIVEGEDSLMFLRDGTLVVQPFDMGRLQTTGDPMPVPGAERVGFNPAGPRGMFSTSLNGVLAYRTRTIPELGGSIAAATRSDGSAPRVTTCQRCPTTACGWRSAGTMHRAVLVISGCSISVAAESLRASPRVQRRIRVPYGRPTTRTSCSRAGRPVTHNCTKRAQVERCRKTWFRSARKDVRSTGRATVDIYCSAPRLTAVVPAHSGCCPLITTLSQPSSIRPRWSDLEVPAVRSRQTAGGSRTRGLQQAVVKCTCGRFPTATPLSFQFLQRVVSNRNGGVTVASCFSSERTIG
jgi:hypothetical protein